MPHTNYKQMIDEFDKQFNILFKENRKWFLQKDKQKWKGCIEVTERELIKLRDEINRLINNKSKKI